MAKVVELTTRGGEPITQTLPLEATEAGEQLTVATLRAAAAALLADDNKAFSLRYTDSDGDEVTIASDADVKELADYMADEQLERVTVLVAPQDPAAGRRAASAVQTQLRGLVTAMSNLTTGGNLKKATPANAMNLMVACLQTMDVAEDSEELAAVKKELLGVLEDEEFKKVVEELSASEEFEELADVMVAAIYAEDSQAIEETATARFEELLVFAQRVVVRCPTLKPAMVNVAKQCMTGLVRYNDDEMADDGSDSSSSSSSSSSDESPDFEASVHFGVICNSCEKVPLVGVRYKALEVLDFDLCEDCEASGKWVSHEPFIKITDPSRAPKHKRTSELVVHPFVVCDGCEMSPIVGIRFKSKTADDFDLCEACEASGKWTEGYGPFTKIQEPGMMHALKFTCRRGGKFGHHGKFDHHHGKFGHHDKFGRHGQNHGPPGFPFHGSPPPHHHGPPGFGPPPHFEDPPRFPRHAHHEGPPGFSGHGPPPHHEGPPDFPEHGLPPHHDGPPDFGGRGRPDFHGHHGHGPPPPPPEFDRPWHHHGPPGFEPPGSFGHFGPRFPSPHGPPPCPPDFTFSEFDPRGYRGFRGHHGRHGRHMRFAEDEEEQQKADYPSRRHVCSGRIRWDRDASDLQARFLEDVTIEDGTVVETGKPLRKMWKLVNDGERSWPDGCYMISQRGNSMFPEDMDPIRIDLPALAPGEEFIAGVDLVAPKEPGRYANFWRVCDPAGMSFGHRFWIDIEVAGDAVPETTPSDASTADSADDSEMEGASEADLEADTPSDDDIEIIEAAEAQQAEVDDDTVENVNEDKNTVIFKKSLMLLASMGFTELDKNLRALELADGNVGAAVNALLSE